MRLWNSTLALYTALGLAAGVAASSGDTLVPAGRTAFVSPGVLPSVNNSTTVTMRFLEARIRRDPQDAGAAASLAAIYLQRVRETGSIEYLDLARRAALASLASVPAVRNAGGLATLAHTEFASHEFVAARDHALELTKIDPGQGYVYGLLGDALLELGDYEAAERQYREALSTFPNYVYALASLGRVRAARGDLQDAIGQYERAVERLPDPTFVAALGDLYKLAGKNKMADAQYLLVEQIGHLSAATGALYNRQLALFYADHDLQPEIAYANATTEFSFRRDLYGADAVAWTALKAHKIDEAQAAIKEALRLGTQDAKLFYHAGMIARAAGDETAAREYIKNALALNPQFDPLQALLLKANLGE